MGQQDELVEFAKLTFMPLVEHHGFCPPTIVVDRATTQIDFLSQDIGIEIEFDWRDFDVFVLVVRLEDGRLPRGYYVSNGRRCRRHLHEILQERGWFVPSVVARSVEKASEARMRATIAAQQAPLLSHIDELLSIGEALF